MNVFGGIVFIILAILQFYFTWKNFQHLKKEGSKNTSPFILPALWSSVIMGIALIIAGLIAIF